MVATAGASRLHHAPVFLKKETAMLTQGPAKKVTIFLNEDTRHHATPLHDAVMTFLMNKGVSGATATRAFSGFGAHQALHTPKIEVLAQHLPIRIEFVDTPAKIDEVLPTLYEMVSDGLIEVQDTTVVRHARKSTKPESAAAHERKEGRAKMLRVFFGEADRWHGEPLYDAIVKKLRVMGVAGATVYRGILGYGAKGHEHKQNFFHTSRDLPIMLSVIDSEEKIAAAADAIEAMLEDGLIVISDADIVRLVRSRPAVEASDAGRAAR
jgi:PII-like signaling protein